MSYYSHCLYILFSQYHNFRYKKLPVSGTIILLLWGVPNPFYPPKKVAEITKIPKTAQKYSLLFIFTNLLIFVFMHFIYILYYFNCIYGQRYSYTGVTFKFLMLNLPFLIWNFQNQNKNYMQKETQLQTSFYGIDSCVSFSL